MEVLNKSIQKANIWLKEAAETLDWKDERKTYTALRAVLHALRDRLTNQEAVQLGAQLPTILRGVYYEGWQLKSRPVREQSRYGFLSALQKPFGKDNVVDTSHIARAIFHLLNDKISKGEIDDIRSILPKGINEFWPAPAKSKIIKFPSIKSAKPPRSKQRHTVRELLQAANQSKRAVTGLASTLQPLNEGRVWRILYDPKVPLHGYVCTICASMFAADRESCSYCGSSLFEVEEMAKHIVEFAVAHGIQVDAVKGNESKMLTHSAGGIGAFLKTSRASKAGLA
jgi:uncharacterized protein (DUF2267 family)